MKLKQFSITVITVVLFLPSAGSASGNSVWTNGDSVAQRREQLWVGLDVGSQLGSSYAAKPGGGFDAGVYLRLTLFEEPIGDWGQLSVGVTYWHGPTKRPMAKSDDGKGGDVRLLFPLFQTDRLDCSIGSRLGIEGVNHAQGAVFNTGGVILASYSVADNWSIRFQTLYQWGGEVFALGGGGYSYSFPAISIGIATNIGHSPRPKRN